MGLASLAAFVGILDFDIVQVALPTIRSALSMSYASSEWAISIYGTPLAGFLILSGRVGDLFGSAGYSGLIFIIATHLQIVMGYFPLLAGLALVPAGIFFAICSAYLARGLSERIGPKYVLTSGLASMALAFALFTRINPHMSYFETLLPPLILFSAGTGIPITTAQSLAVQDIEKAEEGLSSGIINTPRYAVEPITFSNSRCNGKLRVCYRCNSHSSLSRADLRN